MPDPLLIIGACVVAGALAGVLILIGSWPWRTPRPIRSRIAAVLGVGAGWFVGCWRLGLRPDWPPREDLDRLLVVLLPALVCVELVAAALPQRRWIVWLLRGLVACGVTPVLLHQSIYLAELGGPGSRAWTTQQTWLILGGLAAGLLFFHMGFAASIHVKNGFFMNWFGGLPTGEEGFEYHVLAMALAAVVAILGSGSFSVDRKLASARARRVTSDAS